MGTEAQQALKRSGTTTRAGSANDRNITGTHKAQALARKRSGMKSRRLSSHEPQNGEWASGQPMGVTDIDGGYGGMGYGPTAGGSKALKKANERADPGRLVRDTISAMSGPKTVRATGSIWDDPNYAAMANEHGAEFAMRARNLDQKINAAKAYQQGRMESMQTQFGMEKMKRDNARDQMAYQQEAATYGSPDQVSEAYGGGAYRDEQGNIIRPGAQRTDPETGLAVEGEDTFTGRDPGPAERVGKASATPGESEAADRAHDLDVESIKGMSEALSTAIENRDKDTMNKLLDQLSQARQGGQGGSTAPKSAADVMQKFKEANPNASEAEIMASDAYKKAINRFQTQ